MRYLDEEDWIAHPDGGDGDEVSKLLIERRADVEVLCEWEADIGCEYDKSAVVRLGDVYYALTTSGNSCPSPTETWSVDFGPATLKEVRAWVAKGPRAEDFGPSLSSGALREARKACPRPRRRGASHVVNEWLVVPADDAGRPAGWPWGTYPGIVGPHETAEEALRAAAEWYSAPAEVRRWRGAWSVFLIDMRKGSDPPESWPWRTYPGSVGPFATAAEALASAAEKLRVDASRLAVRPYAPREGRGGGP